MQSCLPNPPACPKRSRGGKPPLARHKSRLSQTSRQEQVHGALLLAAIKCTEFSCLPASSQGHRGFNSLRFFDYLVPRDRYVLSFFRFIGDLKSISSGYERIIANRTPPRVSTTYKTPNRTPTLLRPSVPSGNHCGSVVCIPSSLPTTMYVVWVFVRRVCVCRKFTTRRGNSLAACSVLWHARDGTLAGLGRGEEPPLHQRCRLGEDDALST
jgi:hypothetical protein